MAVFRIVLLLWTAVMLALHLGSHPILRRALRAPESLPRWLTLANIVRFEGAYYAALLLFVASASSRSWLGPLMVLAGIHLGGWALAELRHSSLAMVRAGTEAESARLDRILRGIQIFDLAEAILLVFVGWKLVLPFS